LKDNKTSEYPYHFIFFDTETRQIQLNDKDIEHVLRLGVACYWRRPDSKTSEQIEYRTFTTITQFWTFVLSKCSRKRRIVIVSHNLPFDMGVIKGWKMLDKLKFKPTKIILDYQCNIWRFRKDTTTLLFIDNMNYFQTSLKVLGESVGLEKLDMPDTVASGQDWVTYCTRDVEILLKAWRNWFDFLSSNDLGSFGYTIASQALNAFRHRFMTTKVSIHTSTKATRLERAAYRGGRNECFRIGEYHGGDFYLLDVNSMYPYVMLKYDYPCNLISTGKSLTLDEASNFIQKYCLIAECVIKTDTPCFGVKVKDKLLFPVGEFSITLTTSELIRAVNYNYVIQINDFALYEMDKLFANYVNFFYAQRVYFDEHKSAAYAYLCKLMLNSLYGKFGQRAEDWEYVCIDPTRDYDWWQEYDMQKKKLFTYRCINHRVEVSTGYHEGFNSLVAISAEVTANARLMLWRLITTAGRDNVYYCDTDSLIVNVFGLENLTHLIGKRELGKLKIVDQTDRLTINNLKDYSFGGKVKIKGIRKDAEMIAYNTYKQYQSVGVKGGLHHQDINRVIWREVTKELSREYLKGEVLSDGRVKPLTLTRLFDTDTGSVDITKIDIEHRGQFSQRYKPKLRYNFVDHTPDDPQAELIREDEKRRKKQDGIRF